VRDTLVIALMPVLALFMVAIAALEASATTHGWAVFLAALGAGIVLPLVATVVLARQGGLFLRDERAINRSRDSISRFGIPAGWLLGAGLIAGFAIGGLPLVVGVAAAGGALLGLWPGIFANYLRLRREGWPA
jgi:uncharacterized oligopeptide transporter (OPT) family protein